MKKLVILAAAMTLGVVLALGAGWYVRGAAKPDAVAAVTDQAALGNGIVQQGIAVKGHWTIEVRNPDGTLAQRSEFDNALTGVGVSVIRRLLMRESKVTSLRIVFDGSASPCGNPLSGDPVHCVISQPQRGETASPENSMIANTLSVTGTAAGVRLAGSKVIARAGDIGIVGTYVAECYWERSEAECLSGAYNPVPVLFAFTSHDLPTGSHVPVVAGQQVLVTVDLSFVAAP